MTDFMSETSAMPVYMIYPRFLMDMDLSETEKLVYVVRLDRARLSRSNGGWTDESGHVFLIYPITALAEAIHKSEMTIKRALTTLEAHGLIWRKRRGLNQANRIYIKLPAEGAVHPGKHKSVPSGENTNDTSEGTGMILLTEQKCSVRKAQKRSTNKNDGIRTIPSFVILPFLLITSHPSTFREEPRYCPPAHLWAHTGTLCTHLRQPAEYSGGERREGHRQV